MAVVEFRLAPREHVSRVRAHALDAAIAVALAGLIAEAMFFAAFAYLNRDEGWYLLSGTLVLRGEVPYRDFPYFQAPLLPYVFGASTAVFGPSLAAGRMFATLLALAPAGLLLHAGLRMRSRATSLGALLILAGTPGAVVSMVTPRGEAVVMPLALLAVALLFGRHRGIPGLVAAPAVLLVASAARLTFLPAFAAVTAFCYWRAQPSRREAALGLMALLALGAALSAPFIAAAPGRALFDVWTAQQARNSQFEGPHSFLHVLTDRIQFIATPWQDFFGVIVPALLVVVLLQQAYQRGWRPSRDARLGDDLLVAYAAMIGMALLFWLPLAGFDHQEGRYFLPSFLLLAIVAADLIVRAARGPLGDSARLVIPVLVALLAGNSMFQFADARELIDRRDLRQTDDVGRYIASITGPDDQIVTFNPTLAVASDRMPARPLLMGQFSFWPYMADDSARRNGVVNANVLADVMLDPRTAVIALDDFDLGLIAKARAEDPGAQAGEAWPFKLFPELDGRFVLVKRVPDFGQFSGTLYVLERARTSSLR